MGNDMRLKNSPALEKERDRRICNTPVCLAGRPTDLLRELRAILIDGHDAGKIRSAPAEIYDMIKVDKKTDIHGRFLITGGDREGERRIKLSNGARLSFALIVKEVEAGLEVLSYSFNLKYSKRSLPRFVRFDLIDAPHEDPVKEPRSHIHHGHDRIRLPAPLLTPTEIVFSLLYSRDFV